MDLICPNCQKRLSLEDKFAGLTVRCPLCQGMFQAPALPTMPPPVSSMPSSPVSAPPAPPSTPPQQPPSQPMPPATPREPTMVLTPDEPTPPGLLPPGTMPSLEIPDSPARTAPSMPAENALEAELLDEPPLPPGEYTRLRTVHLRPDVLSWFPPVCVTLLFLLSLLPWYWVEVYSANLWQLAFTEVNMYTFYVVVLIFIAWPLSVLVFILERNWLPLPEALRPLWPWRAVFVGMALLLPFVFFLGDYVMCMFRQFGNPSTLAMKLAVRIHLIAVLACGFLFWLEQRRARNLPLPKVEWRS